MAKELIAKNMLSKYIARVWFLHGLLPTIAATVMQKHGIDMEDPSMVDYDAIWEFMVKATTAKKAIQWMNREQVTDSSWQHEIKELADHVHAGVAIPKEKEANETMRAPATVPAVMMKSDRMIEELTKLFGQLNMNIGVLVQWIVSQSQVGNGVMHPQAWVYQTSGVSRATQGGGEGGLPEVNGVGAGEMNTYGGRNQGMCWYCLNHDPGMQPHHTQNACPLFLHHIAMGTVHLNENGKVALGRLGEGGAEISFWVSQGSQSDQVIKKVAGTKYDLAIADHPVENRQKPGGLGSLASVGFILVNHFEDDMDMEEEHEFPEGYGQVNIMSVADVNAARVERGRDKKEMEGWKNPTKILKRKQEKEKTYAVGKSIRSGTWEPVDVADEVEEMEVEAEEIAEPVEMVEQTAKKI